MQTAARRRGSRVATGCCTLHIHTYTYTHTQRAWTTLNHAVHLNQERSRRYWNQSFRRRRILSPASGFGTLHEAEEEEEEEVEEEVEEEEEEEEGGGRFIQT